MEGEDEAAVPGKMSAPGFLHFNWPWSDIRNNNQHYCQESKMVQILKDSLAAPPKGKHKVTI